jgi:predicted MFS family arabinose efflux permease
MTDLETVSDVRPEPPAAYRWLVLVVISLAMFANYYVYDSIAPIADILKSDLGFTDANIGSLYSFYSIAAVIVLLLGGVIIDRFGTARSTILFAAICTVAAVVNAVSSDLTVMLTARFLLGVGSEPLIVAITTALAKWFKGKELSFAFGLNLTIARLGSVAADWSPTWAGFAYDGWQGPLVVAAVIGVLVLGRPRLRRAREDRLPTVRPRQGRSGRQARALRPLPLHAVLLVRGGAVRDVLLGDLPFPLLRHQVLHGVLGVHARGGRAVQQRAPHRGDGRDPALRPPRRQGGQAGPLHVDLMMAYHLTPLWVPVTMMGIAFSLIPAVMWPSVAYIVEERRLGTAYSVMTLIQQIGVAGMNWMIGRTNDAFGASPDNPMGHAPGMWIFSVLGFLALLFAVLLRREETGPHAHGLETITTSSPTG